ncbi:interaptin-like isoform X1 [Triplophysa rosa]|uniref:interaptin-like isoform X1 n=1 Tax=Triplophysa rosa TaxID=992332 RepID=UPI002545E1B0|nr:interaptin-like isoform X1 [Triplophysa rosa]
MEKESSKTSSEGVNLCIVAAGKTYGTNVRMIDILSDRIQNLSTVSSVDESNVVLVFCPIVSRAGTDIEAALKRFTDSTASKLKVLVVLHHTFEPEKTVPDSSRCVNRTDILTVDCLFYEDTGLLKCQKNYDAIDKVVKWLIQQGKKIGVNVRPCQTPSRNSFSKMVSILTMSRSSNMCMQPERKSESVQKNIMETENSKPSTELCKKSKHIEETERRLAESDKKIKHLETEKNDLLKHTDELQKQIQRKDKTIEEQDNLLKKTKEKLSQTTRVVEEKQKQIVEKNEKLENMKKLISEKETALKSAVVEMEASKLQLTTLRTELQENVRQLQDERIIKKPSSQSAVQVRRNSKHTIEPEMSGETSNPGCLDSGSELRLVLLGSAGCEKSSAGNIILNREKNQTDTSAETQKSESRQEEVDGKQVTVVETPDWFCPELSLEEARQDARRCIRLSAPGPHAFLLVIPVQKSAGVKREMMEEMEEILGERCWRNSLVLFTVTDEEQEKNIEDFVQSGNQEIQRLVEKCGNRFHCLNIHQSEDGSQVSELLEKIEKMVEGNTKIQQ